MIEFTNEEIRQLLHNDCFTASERMSALYALAATSKYSMQDVPDDLKIFNTIGQIALNSKFMSKQLSKGIDLPTPLI